MNPINPVTTGPNFLELILSAGWVARIVLIILAMASLYAWAVIIGKWRAIKLVREENKKFHDIFWGGKSIEEVHTKTETFTASPLATVFRSGYRELKKLSAHERSEGGQLEIENLNRALSRASQLEIENLEKHMSWLATIASAAPFVGLFGTVWGIMNSFQSIGATGSANLAAVAPGISEALIATALGILAAIPAVVFYNHFLNQIKKIDIDLEGFSQDFLNILQRNFLAAKKRPGEL